MSHMHDYKGWRVGLTALEQGGRWTARIEVYGREGRHESRARCCSPSPPSLQARRGFSLLPGSTPRDGSTVTEPRDGPRPRNPFRVKYAPPG